MQKRQQLCRQRKERQNELKKQHTKARERDIHSTYCSDSLQARASGVRRGAILSLPLHPSLLSFQIWPSQSPPPPPLLPSTLLTPTFTWVSHFPRGNKLTGPVWFRQVGCQCSLQAHGELWIMDLPRVWVPVGLPAAPSPHSCCDWNSQCPINNQWFIEVLNASA